MVKAIARNVWKNFWVRFCAASIAWLCVMSFVMLIQGAPAKFSVGFAIFTYIIPLAGSWCCLIFANWSAKPEGGNQDQCDGQEEYVKFAEDVRGMLGVGYGPESLATMRRMINARNIEWLEMQKKKGARLFPWEEEAVRSYRTKDNV